MHHILRPQCKGGADTPITPQLSESMTQPEETDTHEIKPASHCLNLKPNLSLTAQTETTERKRGGESDTSVGVAARGGGQRGRGVRNQKGKRGRRRAGEHISDRTRPRLPGVLASAAGSQSGSASAGTPELLMWMSCH